MTRLTRRTAIIALATTMLSIWTAAPARAQTQDFGLRCAARETSGADGSESEQIILLEVDQTEPTRAIFKGKSEFHQFVAAFDNSQYQAMIESSDGKTKILSPWLGFFVIPPGEDLTPYFEQSLRLDGALKNRASSTQIMCWAEPRE